MIRFAVYAAVSTEIQAREDRASIPDQIASCRSLIAQHGIEAAGPYIIDGHTRSGYDSLADAMRDIPALQQAVDDAAANRYDILIMDHFDRLGDLSYMLRTRFKKLKKQLFSVRQSGKIIPPEQYNPYMDDAAAIQMHVDGIVQTYRINKIRRGYNIGIPARLEQGLHPLALPFGYEKRRRDQPAIPISEKTALILKMKDWLFAGETLAEITRRANASGVLTHRGKRWDISNVRRVLENPYYAGLVVYGKTSGKKRLPRSRWTFKPGAHEALWNQETYQAILAELDHRQQGRNHKRLYAISGILKCTQCGKRLYRQGGSQGRSYVWCAAYGAGHPHLEYKTAHALVAREVSVAIHQAAVSPSIHADQLEAELVTLKKQRTHIQEGYEAHLYTLAEASQKIIAIEKEMEQLDRKIHMRDVSASGRQLLTSLAQTSPAHIEDWILNGDSHEVNRALHLILDCITIDAQRQLQVVFR